MPGEATKGPENQDYPKGLKSFKQQEVNLGGESLFVESKLAGRLRLYGCPGLGWWSRLG